MVFSCLSISSLKVETLLNSFAVIAADCCELVYSSTAFFLNPYSWFHIKLLTFVFCVSDVVLPTKEAEHSLPFLIE